jgi:hypothetical protein
MPFPRSRVAAVCRRSWKRIRGRLARSRSGRNEHEIRFVASIGRPISFGKTRSRSLDVQPQTERFAADVRRLLATG